MVIVFSDGKTDLMDFWGFPFSLGVVPGPSFVPRVQTKD